MTSLAEMFDDLDGHMIGDEDDLLHEVQIGDVDQVDRLLRAVAWRRRRIAQAEDLVREERERLDEWLDAMRHRFDPAHLLIILEGYHRARLADDPRAKTISLPSGTLTARKGQPRWDIDAEVFLPWAQEFLPDAVRTKAEADRAALKSLVSAQLEDVAVHPITADGEVVPGVVVEPAEVKFAVKVGDE